MQATQVRESTASVIIYTSVLILQHITIFRLRIDACIETAQEIFITNRQDRTTIYDGKVS